jgi:hypothetical protein
LITAKDPAGYPSSLAYDDFDNFAPRFGFAYKPKFLRSKTVFRGAYGIFYQREAANTWVDLAINDPFSKQTTFTLETDQSSQFFWRNFDMSRPTALALPIRYSSFRWTRTGAKEWFISAISISNSRSVSTQSCKWLMSDPGLGPIQQRRSYPNLGQVNGLGSGGDSNYHSLQASAEKRFSHGILFMAGYTYGKCISNSDSTFVGESTAIQNGRDFRQQRGLCTQHFGQRFTLSWLYDLPFGRGRALMTSAPRVVDLILGGWQFNGIYTARSGSPFTVGQAGDAPNVGDGSARPDQIGNPNEVQNRSIDRWFNTDAFAPADRFRWGTAGRNTVIGPGINNWDFSIFKSFSIDETRKFQFRSEFFNLLNHPEFGFPGSTIGTAQFGRISGTTRDPRDIQLSLKFLW